MASAIAQLIAQQQQPDAVGTIGRAAQTMAALEAVKGAPLQRQMQQQQIGIGQKQLASLEAQTQATKRAEGLKLAANAALQIDQAQTPQEKQQIYQEVRRQAEMSGFDVAPWPTEYSDQTQSMLNYAKTQIYGGEKFKTDEAIRKEKSKPVGPASSVGKLMADRAAAIKAGADQATIKAYDDAIAKVGQGQTINLSINDGKQSMTKPTANKVQDNILAAESALSSLDSIAGSFSGDYLTYQGRAKALGGRLLDKAGMDNDLTKFNASRTKLRNEVNQFFNQYRKEITGAAASEKELEQLKDSMMNEDMGPAEFKAAYDQFNAKTRKNLELNKRTARGGVDVAPGEDYKNMSDADLMEVLGIKQ